MQPGTWPVSQCEDRVQLQRGTALNPSPGIAAGSCQACCSPEPCSTGSSCTLVDMSAPSRSWFLRVNRSQCGTLKLLSGCHCSSWQYREVMESLAPPLGWPFPWPFLVPAPPSFISNTECCRSGLSAHCSLFFLSSYLSRDVSQP